MPRLRGKRGRGRFLAGSNRPSASSLAFSLRKASYRRPAPARRIASAPSWNSPRASYSEGRARISTWSPLAGVKSANWLRPRNITQRTCAFASFSEKYQWPEAARMKLETSPSTHSKGNCDSSARRAMRLSSLTVSTGKLGAGSEKSSIKSMACRITGSRGPGSCTVTRFSQKNFQTLLTIVMNL